MAKKPQLDVRKLKDEVAEYLKKQKWEKAADVLEQLAAAESKDMTHRLRLGDAYRRLEQVEKAITNYQHAAKVFSDEGQLIKAIGAVKIILEIDPRNAEAQKQLGEMNDRRFNKVTLESAGLKTKAFVRATAAIELDEPDDAAPAADSGLQRELSGGGDEEDLGRAGGTPPKKPAGPAGGPLLPPRAFHGPSAIPPPAPKAS